MNRKWTPFVLGGIVLVPFTFAHAQAAQLTASGAAAKPAPAALDLPDIPSVPKGKSTIMGGAIRSVDPVRDQFMLHVYGVRPFKILFDARTQIFQDGKRIPMTALSPADHASVQTTLADGQIFALTIHIMAKLPQGDYQGQVVSYDPGSGQLVLSGAQGGQPFRLTVNQSTSFARQGQDSFTSGQSGPTDLVPGALVSVKFDSTPKGTGIAHQITVLATPGSTFLFAGSITSLDVASGTLTLVDPRYNMSYQISFDTRAGNAASLHVGQHVRVSADYDGHRYVATSVQPEPAQ